MRHHDPGKQRGERINFYRIDADLPVYSWSSNTPVYAGFGTRNATWAPLIEKAMAFHRSGAGSYSSLDNGGWFDEMYSALGVSSSDRWPDEFTSAKNMLAAIEAELAHGKVVTIATRQINEAAGSMLVGGHAYTVVRVIRNADGSRSAVLRNPWAVDGGNVPSGRAEDGYLTISAAQLKLATLAFTTAQA